MPTMIELLTENTASVWTTHTPTQAASSWVVDAAYTLSVVEGVRISVCTLSLDPAVFFLCLCVSSCSHVCGHT